MRRLWMMACLLGGVSAVALDTTEPFEPGFSDVEFYYSRGSADAQGLSTALGFGVSRLFNPVISPEVTYEGTQPVFGVGIQSTMNVYADQIEVDLIPGFSTDFNASQLSLGTEWTLPLSGATPYVQTQADLDLTDSTLELGLALGTAIAVSSGAELFVESGYVWAPLSHFPRAAIGLNVSLSDKLELITEIGYAENWNGAVGLIQTL